MHCLAPQSQRVALASGIYFQDEEKRRSNATSSMKPDERNIETSFGGIELVELIRSSNCVDDVVMEFL